MPSVVTSSMATSENHDGTQDLAPLHLVEGLLDTSEGDDLRDEGFEIETALLVEIDQHRKVATRKAVAVPTRLERTASTEDVEERKRQLHVGPRNTDEHDGAGEVAGLEALRIDLG